MKQENKIALYVAYYLSRFDTKGYLSLGFSKKNKAHLSLGKTLDVKPNTLRNMRDEFDPLHNHRDGWYQRPLGPSRKEVVKALEDLDEEQIKFIIEEILDAARNQRLDKVERLLSIFSNNKESSDSLNNGYVLRGKTGKQAEEYFIDFFEKYHDPIYGNLKDTRTFGCGYDFEILRDGELYYVEVKGISDITGGILFTNKEWITAREQGSKYYLAVVSKLPDNPTIKFIQDPAQNLNPQKQIYTSIQVQWIINKIDPLLY